MKLKRTVLTNLAFLIFAILLLLLSVFSYQRINQQAAAADLVDHTYLVKLKLADAFATVVKAESAQRGYIVTRDSNFVNQFSMAKASIPQKLTEIASLVSDNPEQEQNAKIVSHLTLTRIKWLQMVLDTADHVTIAQLDSFLITGKSITDSLSGQIRIMNNSEDGLLLKRLAEKQKKERNSSSFILIFSIFSILMLLLAFFRIKREGRLLSASEITKNVLEKQVRERTTEIQAVNEVLSAQNQELERKNEELNSFTFIASHDLKEPLRKIEIYTGKIIHTDESILSDNGKNYLKKITDSIHKMKNLIDSIFAYAQTETELKLEATDLSEIARQAINTLQETIQEKQATIEYENLPSIHAMPDQMEQLFTNLISNSLKYSKAHINPHIKIEAEKQNDNGGSPGWKIIFTDNGIGFDDMYKEKIFQIFQRLHHKGQYSGTGIGLAICKKIVENHRGSITARSITGGGAVFTIILPGEPNNE